MLRIDSTPSQPLPNFNFLRSNVHSELLRTQSIVYIYRVYLYSMPIAKIMYIYTRAIIHVETAGVETDADQTTNYRAHRDDILFKASDDRSFFVTMQVEYVRYCGRYCIQQRHYNTSSRGSKITTDYLPQEYG